MDGSEDITPNEISQPQKIHTFCVYDCHCFGAVKIVIFNQIYLHFLLYSAIVEMEEYSPFMYLPITGGSTHELDFLPHLIEAREHLPGSCHICE